MTDAGYAGDKLLDAWLNLTSVLWNTRLVSSMTFNEAHVMGILLRRSTPESPMTATDLIRHTRLLKSQMNGILTALEKRGHITRSRADQDKRMMHILLTQAGKEAYLAEHRNVEAFLSRVIDSIGADRALAIAQELNTVVSALDDIVPACR